MTANSPADKGIAAARADVVRANAHKYAVTKAEELAAEKRTIEELQLENKVLDDINGLLRKQVETVKMNARKRTEMADDNIYYLHSQLDKAHAALTQLVNNAETFHSLEVTQTSVNKAKQILHI